MHPASVVHLSTSANSVASRLATALGGRGLEVSRNSYIKPLRWGPVLREKLSRAPAGKPARMLAVPAGLAGSIVDILLERLAALDGRSIRHTGFTRKCASGFDERYDRLWAAVSDASTVGVVRDAEYLSWRYGDWPFGGTDVIELSHDGDLVGFVAIRAGTTESGLEWGHILDLVVDPKMDGVRETLATVASQELRQNGAAGVGLRTGHGTTTLEQLGFRRRSSEYAPVTWHTKESQLARAMEDEANWYLGLGDGDAAFAID